MSKTVEIEIYKATVKPMFGSETWVVAEMGMNMGEENIKNGTWTAGGGRNMENKN